MKANKMVLLVFLLNLLKKKNWQKHGLNSFFLIHLCNMFGTERRQRRIYSQWKLGMEEGLGGKIVCPEDIKMAVRHIRHLWKFTYDIEYFRIFCFIVQCAIFQPW